LALFGSALEINSEVSQITFLSFLAEEASMPRQLQSREQGKSNEYFKFGCLEDLNRVSAIKYCKCI
jgi:hypothetical protein